MIEIDGGLDEGGGQILRLSLSLSAILKKPIRVFNIRKNRPRPGLAQQHLIGIKLMSEICGAETKGLQLGSTEIEFIPKKIKGGNYIAEISTAGSITLLVQVFLPVVLFSNCITTVKMKGGTNTEMAPQIDYLKTTFLNNLIKFDAKFEVDVIRRGYFPKGDGLCIIKIDPVKQLTAVDITDFGNFKAIFGECFISGKYSENVKNYIFDEFVSSLNGIVEKQHILIKKYFDTRLNDTAAVLNVTGFTDTPCFLGASFVTNKLSINYDAVKKAGENMGRLIHKKICVDPYCQDQLLIFMALANGTSKIKTCEITSHSKTAIKIIEMMTQAKFQLIEQEDGICFIECKGIGYVNEYLKD